jgi:thymidine phosphorylase
MPQFLAQLGSVGCAVCAASESLAPADRKLYALRDVTGTVESIPLIASSIMSKKIAEGTGALVLDVKVGSGAFMKDLDRARELARTMVELGGAHGVDTVALLTDMSTPLGYAVGNGIEVAESVEVLAGGGPADVVELTVALAREMLAAAARTGGSAALADVDPAEALRDGRAMDRWRAMVKAQGGDPDAPLPAAAETELLRADRDGVVSTMDAYGVGVAAWRAGAGRARKEDAVSPGAAVLLRRRPGDRVAAGDVLAELRADDATRIPGALAELRAAIEVTTTGTPAASAPAGEAGSLVLGRISG